MMSVGWWLLIGYVSFFGILGIRYWISVVELAKAQDRCERYLRSFAIKARWRSRTLGQRKVRRG